MVSPDSEEARRIPPYGPARGMLQGLQLLQRVDPARVDEPLLRTHQIAPNNEYKVIGALHFLGLIDEFGRPTDKARLLKTRGGAFLLNLQTIVREAYAELFHEVDLKHATREDIYNYFVTHEKLGAEMATKAARFFTQVCRVAEIDLPNVLTARRTNARPAAATARPAAADRPRDSQFASFGATPFLLLITPEIAALNEDQLTALFEKIGNALRRAAPAQPPPARRRTRAGSDQPGGSRVDRN